MTDSCMGAEAAGEGGAEAPWPGVVHRTGTGVGAVAGAACGCGGSVPPLASRWTAVRRVNGRSPSKGTVCAATRGGVELTTDR
ncbi:hypothetical protein [Streptomyces niveus]|uniref:hypothetical protein n=1 Tax=Streptomyces niveus TaxID=193462 RepID=UPI00114D091E|nr:hypothetical protein [Streptomyces niveus]